MIEKPNQQSDNNTDIWKTYKDYGKKIVQVMSHIFVKIWEL